MNKRENAQVPTLKFEDIARLQQQNTPAYGNTRANQPPAQHYSYLQSTPEYPQYPQHPAYNYNHNQPVKKSRNFLIGVGSVVATIAAAGSLYLVGDKDSDQPSSSVDHQNDSSLTVGEQAPLDIYSKLYDGKDYARYLDEIIPILEQSSADPGSLPSTETLTGDRKWAQEVMNNASKTVAVAFEQQNTVLGRNLLLGAYAPGEGTLKNLNKLIGSGAEPQIPRFLVGAVSKPYSTGRIERGDDDLEITSETRLINGADMNTSTEWNVYITKKVSQSGAYEVPVILGMYSEDHSAYISGDRVADWDPTS